MLSPPRLVHPGRFRSIIRCSSCPARTLCSASTCPATWNQIHDDAAEALRVRPALEDQDRDHEGPPVVQRPDHRPALHPHRRRLHRQDHRDGQPPTTMKSRYNWARVITHEMTHVINLQQTDFNIPHWYTECLAVESEKEPPPPALEQAPDGARGRPQEAPEPRHHQPRVHPPERGRRPSDGVLPGPALRPVHAPEVRPRRQHPEDAPKPTDAA